MGPEMEWPFWRQLSLRGVLKVHLGSQKDSKTGPKMGRDTKMEIALSFGRGHHFEGLRLSKTGPQIGSWKRLVLGLFS